MRLGWSGTSWSYAPRAPGTRRANAVPYMQHRAVIVSTNSIRVCQLLGRRPRTQNSGCSLAIRLPPFGISSTRLSGQDAKVSEMTRTQPMNAEHFSAVSGVTRTPDGVLLAPTKAHSAERNSWTFQGSSPRRSLMITPSSVVTAIGCPSLRRAVSQRWRESQGP